MGADPLEGLPLRRPTEPGWAQVALSDVNALLVDHVHCEQKAACTALALIGRFSSSASIIRPMLALAREELRHFRAALDHLESRGGALSAPRPDRYACEVRRLSCSLPGGLGALGDLLITGAFIEARSAERFRLLANALAEAKDSSARKLGSFFGELGEAESRHWELFRDLAVGETSAAKVATRLEVIAEVEGELVASLPAGPRMH